MTAPLTATGTDPGMPGAVQLAWLREVVGGLGDLSRADGPATGATSAELVDLIAGLEELKAAASAAQSAMIVRFDWAQVAAQRAVDVDYRKLGRGIAEQVALACKVGPTAGARRLETARVLHSDLIGCLDLLSAGEISEHVAQLIVTETSHLDASNRQQVDKQLVAAGVHRMGPREAAATARKFAYAADPAGSLGRGRTARSERRVTCRPAPDTMAYVSAFLPVEQGVQCWTALARHADTTKAGGDGLSFSTSNAAPNRHKKLNGATPGDTLWQRYIYERGLMSGELTPTAVAFARVFLVLVGFVSVVGGLVGLGPDASSPAYAIGVTLLGVGLLAWALVWRLRRLRRPGRLGRRAPAQSRAVPVTAVALAVVTAAVLAVALVPAGLPASASTSGLENNQSPTTPPEPDPTGYVPAIDGTPLAYFADVPPDPVATLVFYHGSGANAGAGYLDFGRQLAERYHVATYLFDMRGHGRSGGRRGDAPSQRQVFADTQSAVDFVHRTNPRLPEYVGGHSSDAGVVLNSEDRISHEVAGYVYLAPDFGLHSDTERQSEGSNFVRISHRMLIADVVTNGLLDAHAYAVSFAYNPEEISRAGLVSRYTSTMAIAQDAGHSAAILAGTHQPVGVWIGSDDEVFDAARVLAWARQAPRATTTTLPGVNHLGVVDRSVADVGVWLDRQASH